MLKDGNTQGGWLVLLWHRYCCDALLSGLGAAGLCPGRRGCLCACLLPVDGGVGWLVWVEEDCFSAFNEAQPWGCGVRPSGWPFRP
jgi:hypothetical protein